MKLVVMNQRGGVGKTTTALTVARHLADEGRRTLLIDADPQGSIATLLRLQPERVLYNVLIDRFVLDDCVIKDVCPKLDVLCGNRRTHDAEIQSMPLPARERLFEDMIGRDDGSYDSVVIDASPSVSVIQMQAMVYAGNLLIPVDMDILSVSGAAACIQFCKTLSSAVRSSIKPLALLPTQVDQRYAMTKIASKMLQELSSNFGVPLLPPIRTDASIGKATRSRQFLADFDPKCKALEDYRNATQQLFELDGEQRHAPEAVTTA